MNRVQLDELMRVLGDITGLSEIQLVGSQSILGSFADQDLPPEAVRSAEIDAVLAGHSQAGAVIRQLGAGSLYADRFDIWVDVVSEHTADFPAGWRKRQIAYHSSKGLGPVALCPEVTDLAASKAARLEINDQEFIAALIGCGYVDATKLKMRIAILERSEQYKKARAIKWLAQFLPAAARFVANNSSGRCRVCHRILQSAEAVKSGIGSTCAKKEQRTG